MASTLSETELQEVKLVIEPDLVSRCETGGSPPHIFHGNYIVTDDSESPNLQWLQGLHVMLDSQDLQDNEESEIQEEPCKHKDSLDGCYVIRPMPNDYFGIQTQSARAASDAFQAAGITSFEMHGVTVTELTGDNGEERYHLKGRMQVKQGCQMSSTGSSVVKPSG